MENKEKNIKMIKVLIPNVKGKALIQSEGNIYIIQSMGYWTGQEIKIDLSAAIEVPSLLYGVATLYNDDFESAVKFIKENW